MSNTVHLVDILGYEFYLYTFALSLLFLPFFILWYIILLAIACTVFKLLVHLWRIFISENIQGQGRGIFITGCDSGFGFMFAEHFDALGFTVFAGCLSEKSAGARKLRAQSSRRLHVVEVDVTKERSVANAFAVVKKKLPNQGLWGVVNNAGINVIGEVELAPVSLYQRCWNVNFYGAVRVIRNFLPLIRKSKGRIVNISSVHGLMSIPVWSVYSSSKYAIEAMSDSLRLEMTKFDVKVSIVEPGAFASATSVASEAEVKRMKTEVEEMWDAASSEVKSAYKKRHLLSWLFQPKGSFPPADDRARDVVSAVEHALCCERPKSRYFVWGERQGTPLHIAAWFNSLVPTWMMDKHIAYWRQSDTLHH